MPNWANLMLTKKGKALQAKAVAGELLTITKMKLGSGTIPDGVSPEDLNDLIQPKQILGLTAIEAKGNLAKIQSVITNVDLSEGYYIRECGVFAQDPDEGEIMYAIMTDTSPDFLPPIGGSIVISEEFSINVVTENMANITAIIDHEGIVTVANARKIAEDKVVEHNEDTEAHPNDFNLKGITIGKDNVIANKKGDLLTLLAGKGINLFSDIKNKIITIVGKSKNAWNPNEKIIAGDIRYTEDGNGPSWVYLLCKTAGTTGTIEPILKANAIVGQEINDGRVVWTVQNIRTTALDSYPVGSIYMSVNSTSPADLFGGTWDAMPAGRVLLAQGKSQWGTTYTAGSTGGEATHLLTPEEMPRHKHDAVANNVNISGTAYLQMGNGISIATGPTTGVFSAIGSDTVEGYGSGSRSGTNGLKFNSTHTPTISISYTGADTAHNNLQPFIAVFMWRRTA